jgi:hypothetical protein
MLEGLVYATDHLEARCCYLFVASFGCRLHRDYYWLQAGAVEAGLVVKRPLILSQFCCCCRCLSVCLCLTLSPSLPPSLSLSSSPSLSFSLSFLCDCGLPSLPVQAFLFNCHRFGWPCQYTFFKDMRTVSSVGSLSSVRISLVIFCLLLVHVGHLSVGPPACLFFAFHLCGSCASSCRRCRTRPPRRRAAGRCSTSS